MVDVAGPPSRGIGGTMFRDVRCKDCLREQFFAARAGETLQESESRFEYSEAWASKMLDRGGSRTDRCTRHRREHRQTIEGIAVAYVDLVTIGEVADRQNPTGPLGGLGELPATHRPKPVSVDLAKRQFGMTDDHIREALRKLGNDKTRVLVLRAGTGTGKSTFAPYRLLNPPTGQPGDEDLIQLTKLGPIIVTEPRVQATTGVARFVGEKLVVGCKWKSCSVHGRFVPARDADPDAPEGPDHFAEMSAECVITDCSDHIGPGYPVGYQVKDDKKHDDSCQLVFVTDGTMVNWLREGRLSKIGTVIVDEAHERSVNIDFILGELKRQLPRYPHLRVIVTSATFDIGFYVNFFGGPDVVADMDVPAVKTFGYGAPFFPHADAEGADVPACQCPPLTEENTADHPHRAGDPTDLDTWLTTHWPQQMGPPVGDRGPEDLHATTRKLERLRFPGPLLDGTEAWGRGMPGLLVDQVIRMINGLNEMGIHGDILAFLPTANMIVEAVAAIEQAVAPADPEAPKRADVFGLVGSMPKDEQAEALAARPPDARRKVVIATNLAETSLTVEGVRFVVDSGIITQSTWNPATASGQVPTLPHSRAGIKQRWGRVGRDAPGWVFPLYTLGQFQTLPRDTPPGSTRENLEKLIMTAKAGGVDDLADFPWPAAWEFGELDVSAKEAQKTFDLELARAEQALILNGVLDAEHGHLTSFGKEMQRFAVTGASAATALSIMLADQLACVPEVSAALALLAPLDPNVGLARLFLAQADWPIVSQTAAGLRRTALKMSCRDDLDLVLRISAGWDRADREAAPWELTDDRRQWCASWWLNEKVLVAAAEMRHESLAALSPAMKEEVKRFIDPRLSQRVRAVLSRAMPSYQYVRVPDTSQYTSVIDPAGPAAKLNKGALTDLPDRVLALSRTRKGSSADSEVSLAHLVRVLPWAVKDDTDVFEFMERVSLQVAPRLLTDRDRDDVLPHLNAWPIGMTFRGRFNRDAQGMERVDRVLEILPLPLPPEPRKKRLSGESNWLLGPSLEDEEALAKQPFDTADDPDDPEKGLEHNEPVVGDLSGAAEDVLAAWVQSVAEYQVSNPRIYLDSASDPADQRLVWGCVNYRELSDGDIALMLATQICIVEVDVPRQRRFGPGRVDQRTLSQRPDIVSCDYLPRNGPLRIVATNADAVRAVLMEISPSATSIRGTMTMPTADDAKHIVGAGGTKIRQLRELSGVTDAQCPRGSDVWALTGPTVESIERFIRESATIVAGCYGEVKDAPSRTTIKDRIAKREIGDWRAEPIEALKVADWHLPNVDADAHVDESDLGTDVALGLAEPDRGQLETGGSDGTGQLPSEPSRRSVRDRATQLQGGSNDASPPPDVEPPAAVPTSHVSAESAGRLSDRERLASLEGVEVDSESPGPRTSTRQRLGRWRARLTAMSRPEDE